VPPPGALAPSLLGARRPWQRPKRAASPAAMLSACRRLSRNVPKLGTTFCAYGPAGTKAALTPRSIVPAVRPPCDLRLDTLARLAQRLLHGRYLPLGRLARFPWPGRLHGTTSCVRNAKPRGFCRGAFLTSGRWRLPTSP
jgi:hypothetical protein